MAAFGLAEESVVVDLRQVSLPTEIHLSRQSPKHAPASGTYVNAAAAAAGLLALLLRYVARRSARDEREHTDSMLRFSS